MKGFGCYCPSATAFKYVYGGICLLFSPYFMDDYRINDRKFTKHIDSIVLSMFTRSCDVPQKLKGGTQASKLLGMAIDTTFYLAGQLDADNNYWSSSEYNSNNSWNVNLNNGNVNNNNRNNNNYVRAFLRL